MAPEVTIYIDGKEVKTTSDKMVLQAANDAGIYVPYLCYHPGMKPYGACRMCVVEVEGAPGTPASCTLPVRDGMRVSTGSQAVEGVRRTVTDLLLSEHPQGCLTCHRVDLCGPQDICLRHVAVNDRCIMCPKNERCELKDTTRYVQMEQHSPLTYQYRNLQIETRDPFYDRDYNLCIVCGRCVRACDELRGDVAIAFTERAGQALVGTSRGTSLLESGCEFCGACIDVCPVGALVERDYKWEKPVRHQRTICPHCPVGCQINYEVDRRERVIRAIPDLNAPVNLGQACYKGKFGFNFVNHKQRLAHPLVRRNGELQEATWDEALTMAAQGLAGHRGPSFAALLSPRATNEEAYLLQKFARTVMESNNVHVASSSPSSALLEGLGDVLGYQAGTNPIWDLEQAGCVLSISNNVTEEQNVVAVPVKRAVRKGTKLIVVDAREVELTRYAHLWLRPYPGTDLALVGGMLRAILDEGLADEAFLKDHAEGLEALRRSLAEFGLERVAAETGVPADQVREAARIFATSRPSAILCALDNVPAEQQRPCARALAELAAVTGNVGKPGAGIYPLVRGANEQGARDMGCDPHFLPGYQPVTDEAARRLAEGTWGRALPQEPGLPLDQLLEAARQGQVRVMLLVGDVAAHYDGAQEPLEAALQGLDFLVVQDAFLSPAARHAHVVFPAETFAEKEGTYTNVERRVQPLRRVFKAPHVPEVQPDWWTLCQIARHMGAPGFDFSSAAEVLGEAARVNPLYAGISYRRLVESAVPTCRPSTETPLPTQVEYSEAVYHGLMWPCPEASHQGTQRLHAEGAAAGQGPEPTLQNLAMGRIQEGAGGARVQGQPCLVPLDWAATPRSHDPQRPLLLAMGRVLQQPQRETEVVRGKGLNRIQREELLEMHPEDAAAASLREGQSVRVIASGHTMPATVRLAPGLPRGVVAMTRLFGGLAVQLAASEAADPMARVPRLDVVPAQVEPAGPPA
ncbi:MAG: molybdopterin-dependent oxidoreductase [Chloroflexi bacterium]|nr:molybdopterin-dependent oxidoreductase [Chloroflexota bacterium]